MKKLGATDLLVHPLCLGGNVFGWTADEAQSFAVLDAYVARGGNFIDTADVYSAWAPGHVGGESESILGRWMAARKNRASLVIATKVGMLTSRPGLTPKNLRAAAEDSLRRLGTDVIDLYYAHRDDEATPLADTMGGFDALVREGKVRHVAASNYSPARLGEALAVSKRDSVTSFVALQPEYNLVVRRDYEESMRAVVDQNGLACFPYFSLAKGFLTGKYRRGSSVESARASGAMAYLDARGEKVLATLDRVASSRAVPVSAVALAWLVAQPTVTSVLASARTVEQLEALLPVADLALSKSELDALTDASS